MVRVVLATARHGFPQQRLRHQGIKPLMMERRGVDQTCLLRGQQIDAPIPSCGSGVIEMAAWMNTKTPLPAAAHG